MYAIALFRGKHKKTQGTWMILSCLKRKKKRRLQRPGVFFATARSPGLLAVAAHVEA